jgi:hypothetical protein
MVDMMLAWILDLDVFDCDCDACLLLVVVMADIPCDVACCVEPPLFTVLKTDIFT